MARILVVDDEKSICELLEITFRKEGHRVEVAHSVEAAKRKLESQIFDIVISDFRMPGRERRRFVEADEGDCAGLFFPVDHGRADRRDRDRGDQFRRGPIRDQGSRTGGAVAAGGPRGL